MRSGRFGAFRYDDASAYSLADRARYLSTVAQMFGMHVRLTEQSIEELTTSCHTTVTDAVDLGRATIDSDVRTDESNVGGKYRTAVCRSQEGRGGQSQ